MKKLPHSPPHSQDIGVDHVVVCGLLTSGRSQHPCHHPSSPSPLPVCVLFTCQSAFAAGMRVTLFESACGDRTRERHMQLIDMYKASPPFLTIQYIFLL